MNIHVTHEADFTFPDVTGVDADLRPDGAHLRAVVMEARRKLCDATLASEWAAWTVVAVLGSARLGEPFQPPRAALDALVDWAREEVSAPLLFWFFLADLAPGAVLSLGLAILGPRPGAVGMLQGAYLAVKGEVRAELQRLVATHPLVGVREYYFALLGKHRRLVPPGSISNDEFAPEVLAGILHAGITDTVPARCRAA